MYTRMNWWPLCDLADAALVSDQDDRSLIQAVDGLGDVAGNAFWAARVPGRVVFLAAIVHRGDEETSAAAARLINDLSAVDGSIPLEALENALLRR